MSRRSTTAKPPGDASNKDVNQGVSLAPYRWAGPYAEMRDRRAMRHDHRLCAQATWPWMGAQERIILRCCELIGDPGGFFYDDHEDVFDADGRGLGYHHVQLDWDVVEPDRMECHHTVPKLGQFGVSLRSMGTFVEIMLSVTTARRVATLDWGFCVILFEVDCLHDPGLSHTSIVGRSRHRIPLSELGSLDRPTVPTETARMTTVNSASSVIPAALRMYPLGEDATAIPVAFRSGPGVELALWFDKGTVIYGNPENECIHVDPYFFDLEPGREHVAHGVLVADESELVDTAVANFLDARA